MMKKNVMTLLVLLSGLVCLPAAAQSGPEQLFKSRLALAIKNLRRDLETDDLAEFVQRDEAIS